MSEIALGEKVRRALFAEFTRAREQSRRCTSCWLLISRLKTATGRFLVHRDVLGDVHRERRFSHARPRGDDDHFRGMQSARHAIEFGKTGREAGDAALRS